MRSLKKCLLLPVASGLALLAGASFALADTKVEVKGVHLCCGACVKGVAAALKDVPDVAAKCDMKNGTVALTAKDDTAAAKGIAALGAAGYFGDTGVKTMVFAPAADVPTGKVSKIALSNAHNCCRSCTTAIKEAIKSVDGVKADTVKPKTADFEVTGDFDAAAVVKALNDAGFQVAVKK